MRATARFAAKRSALKIPALLCTVLWSSAPAQANIMCDPDWVHGRATTVELTIDFLQQMASHHKAKAGRGAEARVCPKLEQFRMFVHGGCISQRHLPHVEAIFAAYACARDRFAENG